jgi:hypothetical protein
VKDRTRTTVVVIETAIFFLMLILCCAVLRALVQLLRFVPEPTI